MEFTFNGFYTLISAVIVLLLGRFLVNQIDFVKCNLILLLRVFRIGKWLKYVFF